jgi:tetratricopeptide (TPR) repeat protein
MGFPLPLVSCLFAILAQARITIGGQYTAEQSQITIQIANIQKYGKEQAGRLIMHEGTHLIYIRRMEEVQAAIYKTSAKQLPLLGHREPFSAVEDRTPNRFAPAYRLVRKGSPREAIAAIRLQMDRSMVKPQDGMVYAMLGTAYLKTGDPAAAIDAFITAVSYNPSFQEAWDALDALASREPRDRLPRLLDGRPELSAILTCGNPVSWPRFAVQGCSTALIRHADRLERDGSISAASKIRSVAVDALLDHARSAISAHAYDLADAFIDLANSIRPLPSLDRRQQETAYWLLSLLNTVQHRYLQAMDAHEHLADLRPLDRNEQLLLAWLVYEAGIAVSWDPETHILRSADRDDFFDSPFHKHRGSIPYGMTSPDEDFAAFSEVMLDDAFRHTNQFYETIRKRLSDKNFELPVKRILASLWEDMPPFDGKKADYHPEWFIGDIHDIDDAMKHAADVPEPTLIALEVAKRTLAIFDRTPRY